MMNPAEKLKNMYIHWTTIPNKKGAKMKKIYLILSIMAVIGFLGGCELGGGKGGGTADHIKSDKGPSSK